MNIPFAPSDRRFQPSWFTRVDDGMIPGGKPPFSPLTKWIAIDTALKDEEHPSGHDYNVVVVGGFDDMGRLYILDIFRDRNWTEKNVGDTVITCMKTAEYGGISRVITEKVGEVRLNNYLRERARQAGVPMQIISITRGGRGSKSKFERIVGTQGYFEQGRVFFRKSCENFDDTVNEFCNLGRWTNDDLADCISMFFDEQVKVMAPSMMKSGEVVTFYRPMPFDGSVRNSAFRQTHGKKELTANDFGRNGEVAVDGNGTILFTPDQVRLFSERPDKKPRNPMAFRPLS
jgi:phage terminase large subunit-like protein